MRFEPGTATEGAGVAGEHTLAELARLDLFVRRAVVRLRLSRPESEGDEFRGLYVTEEDAVALLDAPLADSRAHGDLPSSSGALDAIDSALARVDSRIRSLEADLLSRGIEAPLNRVARLFGLSELDQLALVVCLAPEVDLKYERLYSYLQDDVTKKRPTVDLVIRLLCPTFGDRLAGRRRFEPDAPLLRWGLITVHDDPGTRRPVLLGRYLKLDERIAAYLLASDSVDARLAGLLAPRDEGKPVALSPAVREQVSLLAAAWTGDWSEASPVVLLHGKYGSGKRTAARRFADGISRPLLALSAADLPTEMAELAQMLRLAEREALLTGAVLCWQEVDRLLRPAHDGEPGYRAFVRHLAEGRVATLLLAEKTWEPSRELSGRQFVRLELPGLTYAERHDVWAAALKDAGSDLEERDLDDLVSRFRLTAGQIQDAVARARTLAWVRDTSNGHLSAADIDAACRSQAQHRLSSLARKLETRYTWNDIVLPQSQLSTLKLICTTVRHRRTVYGDWGFDRKLSLGKGLIALLAGPSGTGKTMAAEIMARELGLDLYKINLSGVVSKYIGETEKNLELIFGEAQDSDAILFFDEADALFGKRSEVKDAHDRYANIEISYLLQRTEEYSGLVILASNLKRNMDEAFLRRLHFAIDFPEPGEPERLEIWRRTFPREVPLAEDVDLEFLARNLKFTGGNIRNVILSAAFLAAEDGRPIRMEHLVRSAAFELQKTGRLISESDLERYYPLTQQGR